MEGKITMKRNNHKMLRVVFYTICLSTFFTINAQAYVDPATTSYIIQIVAGIVIAAGTAVGIFWNKIKRKFKKKNETQEENVRTDSTSHGGVVTADDLLSDDDDK